MDTLLRLSRLPPREPKTFERFDFSRIQGRDAGMLRKLPALADLYAHRNIAFIGSEGIGRTHLAQACGRACCMKGLRTHCLKASELRDRLSRAAGRGSAQREVAALVKPSCLILDEIGRCRFDRACTDMFFDIVDRRCEKDGPSTMVLTSNMSPGGWNGSFTGEDALPCDLRQCLGLHDARTQLQGTRARHLLRGGGAPGDEAEGLRHDGALAMGPRSTVFDSLLIAQNG